MTSPTNFLNGLSVQEQIAVDDYDAEAAGIVDCFYGYEPSDLPMEEAVRYLDRWWTALDTLDAAHGDRPSLAAARHLHGQLDNFFRARHRLLLSIATEAGHRIPQPDHTDGMVKTSNRYLGYVGFVGLGAHREHLDYTERSR